VDAGTADSARLHHCGREEKRTQEKALEDMSALLKQSVAERQRLAEELEAREGELRQVRQAREAAEAAVDTARRQAAEFNAEMAEERARYVSRHLPAALVPLGWVGRSVVLCKIPKSYTIERDLGLSIVSVGVWRTPSELVT
jgi:chromosome segregation ATPase